MSVPRSFQSGRLPWIPLLHFLGRADGKQLIAVVAPAVEFDPDSPTHAEARALLWTNPPHLR